MRYLLPCCQKIVDVDNKPKWCIRCGEHNIEPIEFTEETLLPCPFCGGQPQAEALNTVALYWYECQSCEASCGSATDWIQARKNWNLRKG